MRWKPTFILLKGWLTSLCLDWLYWIIFYHCFEMPPAMSALLDQHSDSIQWDTHSHKTNRPHLASASFRSIEGYRIGITACQQNSIRCVITRGPYRVQELDFWPPRNSTSIKEQSHTRTKTTIGTNIVCKSSWTSLPGPSMEVCTRSQSEPHSEAPGPCFSPGVISLPV